MTTEEKKLAPDGREYVTLDLDMTHLFPKYDEFNKTCPKSFLTYWQRKTTELLGILSWSLGMVAVGMELPAWDCVPLLLVGAGCWFAVHCDTFSTLERVARLSNQIGKMDGGKMVKDYILDKLVEEGHATVGEMPSVREEAEG